MKPDPFASSLISLAEAIREDRHTALTTPCPTCGLVGGRFDFEHNPEPFFEYRCIATCPDGHVNEF